MLARFDTRGRAGLILGPLLFIIVGLLLDGHGLSFEARWAGAVVVLMATWWITEPIPLWATACMPLLAYPLLGVASPFAVVLQYFDPVNFLFLGGMMIAASMQQWGLHRRIALTSSPPSASVRAASCSASCSATAFVSLWISNTATTVMMFPIGDGGVAETRRADGAQTIRCCGASGSR